MNALTSNEINGQSEINSNKNMTYDWVKMLALRTLIHKKLNIQNKVDFHD